MLIPQGRMFSQRARARASLCRLDRMLIDEPKGHPSYQARVAVSKLISRVATAWTDRYRHSQSSSASRRRASARSGSPPQQRIECSPRSTRRCRSASPAAGRNRSGWPQRRPTPVRGASRWRDHCRQGSAARRRGRRRVRIRSGGGAPPKARQNQPQLSALSAPITSRRAPRPSIKLFFRAARRTTDRLQRRLGSTRRGQGRAGTGIRFESWAQQQLQPGTMARSDGLACFRGVQAAGCES